MGYLKKERVQSRNHFRFDLVGVSILTSIFYPNQKDTSVIHSPTILLFSFFLSPGLLFGNLPKQATTQSVSSRKGKLWKKFFGSHQGCFLLYDLKKRKFTYQTGGATCRKRFSPCSTYKIPHTLIALESKVIKHPDQILTWDGKKRFYKAWNRSHSLRSAFRYSVVWAYQKIAKRIGRKRMVHWLRTIQYGNQHIEGPIHTFWLRNSLRISPMEQLRFLEKLNDNKLAFSAKSMKLVKEVMIWKKTKHGMLQGKTGSQWIRGMWKLGWFVGYVTWKSKKFIVVTLIHKGKKPRGPKARRITRRVLKEWGIQL